MKDRILTGFPDLIKGPTSFGLCIVVAVQITTLRGCSVENATYVQHADEGQATAAVAEKLMDYRFMSAGVHTEYHAAITTGVSSDPGYAAEVAVHFVADEPSLRSSTVRATSKRIERREDVVRIQLPHGACTAPPRFGDSI